MITYPPWLLPRQTIAFFSCRRRPRPSSTLFPYTTLFRSFETGPGRKLLEVYRPVWTPRHQELMLETYSGYAAVTARSRSEEHTSELQSRLHLVCRLLLEKKNMNVLTPRLQSDSRPTADL